MSRTTSTTQYSATPARAYSLATGCSVTEETGRLGAVLAGLVAAAVARSIVVKWIQRQRFLRGLRIACIGQDALKRDLDAGTAVFIVDLRVLFTACAVR